MIMDSPSVVRGELIKVVDANGYPTAILKTKCKRCGGPVEEQVFFPVECRPDLDKLRWGKNVLIVRANDGYTFVEVPT